VGRNRPGAAWLRPGLQSLPQAFRGDPRPEAARIGLARACARGWEARASRSAVLCRLYDLDGYLADCRDYIASYSNGNAGRAAMRVLNEVQACLLLVLGEGAADEEAAAKLAAA
jgi:hypothetical protein